MIGYLTETTICVVAKPLVSDNRKCKAKCKGALLALKVLKCYINAARTDISIPPKSDSRVIIKCHMTLKLLLMAEINRGQNGMSRFLG